MTEQAMQWVVRGVDRDLAAAFVDQAHRQGRTTGDLLNQLLRSYLDQAPKPAAPGQDPAITDLQTKLASVIERLERLEQRTPATRRSAKPKAKTPEPDDGAFFRGEGAARRMTQAGREEISRRLQAGDRVQNIAEAIGVTEKAIYDLKKKMASLS
jgi:hypothetical protein